MNRKFVLTENTTWFDIIIPEEKLEKYVEAKNHSIIFFKFKMHLALICCSNRSVTFMAVYLLVLNGLVDEKWFRKWLLMTLLLASTYLNLKVNQFFYSKFCTSFIFCIFDPLSRASSCHFLNHFLSLFEPPEVLFFYSKLCPLLISIQIIFRVCIYLSWNIQDC